MASTTLWPFLRHCSMRQYSDLHEYQKFDVDHVIKNPAAGLFLRPGLGKTVITLTAVNELIYDRWAVSKVLVIAPKKVAEATWTAEAAAWGHLSNLRCIKVLGSAAKRIRAINTPADIYITNREFQFTPLREGRLSGSNCLKAGSMFQFTPLREGRRRQKESGF